MSNILLICCKILRCLNKITTLFLIEDSIYSETLKNFNILFVEKITPSKFILFGLLACIFRGQRYRKRYLFDFANVKKQK